MTNTIYLQPNFRISLKHGISSAYIYSNKKIRYFCNGGKPRHFYIKTEKANYRKK